LEKTILITGSSDGIGKATAIQLAEMGHRVIIHARDKQKANNTRSEIVKLTNNTNLEIVWGDLSSQKQIIAMAKNLYSRLDYLDVLINNAGIYQNSKEYSEDNIEMTFAVNHLAPFILTRSLLDLIKNSKSGRIITLSSMIHADSIDFDNLQGEKSFSGSSAYSLSKLCNILFTYKLANEVNEFGITCNCLHPGVINTKLLRKGWGGGGSSPSKGAETSVYLATSDDVKFITKKYFVNKQISSEAKIARDEKTQFRLWEESLRLQTYFYDFC